MSLTAAMLTGFTGIQTNSVAVDTVGDNIANVNTTAFKSQRTTFETLLYNTIHSGQGPSDTTGGTLPEQIGRGSGVASIQRNFQQGGVDQTGIQSDLAIDGNGLFIIQDPNGDLLYTRDGSFTFDATQTVVSASGAPIQVFAADETGAIDEGTLSNLVIPLGTASLAAATTTAEIDGHLDAGTEIASAGAVVASQPLEASSGAAATAATALTDLVNASGVALFADGDDLSIEADKGGEAMPASSFVVGTTGSTLGEFATHLELVLGINMDAATGGAPGVTISDGTDLPAGTLVITSNLGTVNAVSLDAGSITNHSGPSPSPFSFDTMSEAVGGGQSTSFTVYDSLGEPVRVRLRAAMESQADTGTVWRFYVESVDDTDMSPSIGTGTITFDANGQFVGATGTDLTIDRVDTGAETPLSFTLDLSAINGLSSSDGVSDLQMASQDGAAIGDMIGYSVDEQGLVTGTYENQLEQVLGQVALATFTSYEGLVAVHENHYVPGANSGEPTLGTAETLPDVRIQSGHLEQSNVEIAREFINLITASTGISSASRVVRVADDLLKELLLLAR